MIDKSVEDMVLALVKTDTKNYPKYTLPEGYKFAFFKQSNAKVEICS